METRITVSMAGWDRPPPEFGARFLLGTEGRTGLARWGVLVPGRRAGRQFRAALTREAGRTVACPRILTPSTLIEAFFRETGSLRRAPESVALLAWSEALSESAEAARTLFPARVEPGDIRERHERVRHLRAASDALDSIGLTPADLVRDGVPVETVTRWEALEAVRREAHRRLNAIGCVESTLARQRMIDRARFRADAPERLLVLALGDPGPLTCRLMSALGDRCTVLVDAPDTEVGSFDAWGRPCPDAWTGRPSVLPLEHIELVDRPIEAGESVLEELERLHSAHGVLDPGATVVGLCDERQACALERAGRRAGVPLRSAVGRSLESGRCGRLLHALLEHLGASDLDSFARLLALPDVERHLQAEPGPGSDAGERTDLLSRLDDWRADRVGATLADLRSGRLGPDQRLDIAPLTTALVALEAVLEPLKGSKTLPEALDRLTALLERLLPLGTDPALRETLEALVEIVDRLRDPGLDGPLEDAAATVLELIGSELAARPSVPERDDRAIELLGWLELRHEPAEDFLLVGLNEGGELSGGVADAWLPDSLRERLELPCESRRHARNVHALHALAARARSLRAIVTRHDAAGDPVAPSRLALAGDGRELAERVVSLFEGAPRIAVAGALAGTPEPAPAPGFPAIRPRPPHTLDTLHVTDFASWLRSPKDFWLERMEGVRENDPERLELDARQFGNLAHAVVEELGAPELRDVTDHRRLETVLVDRLDELVHRQFGRRPAPAVAFQRHTLAERLRAFARIQGTLVATGWRIETIEFRLDEILEIPGQEPVRIRGRIDRIDRHESGRLRVLDYKTSEQPVDLGKKRSRDGTWKDLQLPLYDHLLRRQRGLAPEEPVELGYVSLPTDPDLVACTIARDWSGEHLEDAIEQARDVVRAMRAGDFSGGVATGWSRQLRPIDRILRTGALDVAALAGDEPVDEEGGEA